MNGVNGALGTSADSESIVFPKSFRPNLMQSTSRTSSRTRSRLRFAHDAFAGRIKFNKRKSKAPFAASTHRIQSGNSDLSPPRDAHHSFGECN